LASLEDRLVQVGVELLESTGADRLGLREIARQAGVSHGAPRRYFPTHQHLLAAIARAGLTDLTVTLGSALSTPAPVPEKLIAGALAYVGFAEQRPEMFRLMFRHDLLTGSGHSLREISMPLLDRLIGVVQADIPARVEARECAVLIWTHVHGLATVAAGLTLEPTGLAAEIPHLVERAVRTQLLSP
jgi:AcrR family transcriptional regulator